MGIITSVMTFIESPGLVDRNGFLVNLLEDGLESDLGSGQD